MSDPVSPPDRMLLEWRRRGFSQAEIVTLLVTMLWIQAQEGGVPSDVCPLCCGQVPASWQQSTQDEDYRQ